LRNSSQKTILALVASVFLLPMSALAQPTSDGFQHVVDEYVEKRSFSGTVLIARKGKVLYEANVGEADIEWNVPTSPQTRYRIASLSKPFIATLIMRLAEEELLSLDGTLGQYLPDLYANTPASEVTVEQLLSHTSGLKGFPRDLNDPWYSTTGRLSFEPKQFAREWIKPEFVAKPGSKWSYSNVGYILLGIIADEVTGEPHSASLERYIFNPAGMENSGVFTESAVIPRLARAYATGPDGKLTQPTRFDASVFYSSAGLYSTARDILRFDQALYGTDIVSAASRERMHTKKTDFPYGYGWGVQQWPLGEGKMLDVVHHTGSIPGYQSFYIRSETNQDFVIVMNNTNKGVVAEMGRNLMIMLNNDKAPVVLRSVKEYLTPIGYAGGNTALAAAISDIEGRKGEFDLREGILNRLGYEYLGLDRLDDAITIFRWVTQLHPNSANPHDSLGEALRKAGQTAEAISSYQKALEIDPDSQSAKLAIEEMLAEE